MEEFEEGLADGAGADVVHGEAGAIPVAGASHGAELAEDSGFVFVFPGLDSGDELVALEVGTSFAFFSEDAFFDDGLGGDSGVVGAGDPDGVVAEHSVIADEDVLEGVVEGVSHVEGGCDVGRGDDDGVGGAAGVGVGVEEVGVVPELLDFAFHGLPVVLGRKLFGHDLPRFRYRGNRRKRQFYIGVGVTSRVCRAVGVCVGVFG